MPDAGPLKEQTVKLSYDASAVQPDPFLSGSSQVCTKQHCDPPLRFRGVSKNFTDGEPSSDQASRVGLVEAIVCPYPQGGMSSLSRVSGTSQELFVFGLDFGDADGEIRRARQTPGHQSQLASGYSKTRRLASNDVANHDQIKRNPSL